MARGNGAITRKVKATAARHGVSERTAWRWHAKSIDADDEDEDPPACQYCGTMLPADATSRRQYCDDVCRQYARRRRLARASFQAARLRRARA